MEHDIESGSLIFDILLPMNYKSHAKKGSQVEWKHSSSHYLHPSEL